MNPPQNYIEGMLISYYFYKNNTFIVKTKKNT